MIINIQKIKDKFTGSRYNINASKKADRDWTILLSIFTFGILFIFTFGIYVLFFGIDKKTKIIQIEMKHIKTINRNDLRNVLVDYASKEDEFKKLLSKQIHFIDPSI